MAEIDYTPSQRSAVFSRGQGLLVSAAAGSGKTFVLTQRLMAWCTDEKDPKDINSFLIITFTRAAAGEMRTRIFDELGRLSSLHPENMHLRRQQALCFSAEIGTIHSFCQTVLKRGCHLLGISPDFRVMQEDRAGILLRSALDRVLEDAYNGQGIGDKEAFLSLADSVGAGRDDSRLAQTVLSLYRSLQSHPYPEKWARDRMEDLRALSPETDILDTVWGRELADAALERVDFCLQQLQEAADQAEKYGDEPLLKSWENVFRDGPILLQSLKNAISSGWDRAAQFYAGGLSFPRKKAAKGCQCPDLSDSIGSVWDGIKDQVRGLGDTFSRTGRDLMAEEVATVPARITLLELALRLDREFAAAKKRENALDFSDLEHQALKLLCTEDGAPTPFASDLSRRYTEIMVDEYQDVNAVQEMIFSAVSRSGRNLFMVGDVKQSIYRFRLADPGIFLGKLRSFSDGEDGPGRRIALQENFRSRDCVIDAVNLVFRGIMSRRLGDVDYDDTAVLRRGLGDEEGRGGEKARLLLFRSGDYTEDDEEAFSLRVEGEAKFIAATIRDYVDRGVTVGRGEKERKCTYDDFAILLRSPKFVGKAYLAALESYGIPADAGAGVDFFSRPEVGTVLDLLEILDNPNADVPLLALLQAPAFAFTADELAQIRLGLPDACLWQAMEELSSREPEGKCARFVSLVRSLRALAPGVPMDTLLWEIYNRTDMLAVCAALPGGEESRRRLVRLGSYAADFETGGQKGLYRFVRQMRSLQESGKEQEIASASGVHFLTIHKSKGLEYPFVFVADVTHKFNGSDAASAVLVHPEEGIGCRYHDRALMAEYPTVSHRAIARRLKRETLSEEMRVLYVAMTRAKQELILTGSLKGPEALVEKARANATYPLPPLALEESESFAPWLAFCAAADESILSMEINPPLPEEKQDTPRDTACPEEAGTGGPEDRTPSPVIVPPDLSYPYEVSVSIPSKLTATELKSHADAEDAESGSLVREKRSAFRLPSFADAGKARPLTGTEKGTAAHAFLQHAALGELVSPDRARAEAQRLCSLGYLTDQQARSLDLEAAVKLMTSPLGRDMLSADRLEREFRFSVLEDASLWYPEAGDEKLLLQGIIDCFFLKDGLLTLLDYKTDHVSAGEAPDRAKAYAPQIEAYSRALEKVLGRRPDRRILFFLSCGRALEV